MVTIIDEQMLDDLRQRVSGVLSGKRMSHTLGVEREITRLSGLYCPERIATLRAAALLHDITKEYSEQQHIAIISAHGIDTEYYRGQSRKIYHSLTASLIIPEQYPEFADPAIVHAVSVHTTGCAEMTVEDKLLYLADYIEDTRTFDNCVMLRQYFWDGIDAGLDKYEHLDRTLLLAFDMTIEDLIENKSIISDITIEARNATLLRLKKKGE